MTTGEPIKLNDNIFSNLSKTVQFRIPSAHNIHMNSKIFV